MSDIESDCSTASSSSSGSSSSYESSSDTSSMDCDMFEVSEPVPITPMYEGAQLTILDSYATLLCFAIRHGLSKQALSELIQLVNLHLPHSSQSLKSVYKLKKLFTDTFDDLQAKPYNYCSSCHALLDGDKCSNTLCDEAPQCKFVMVPLAAQLQRRLEGIHAC